MNWKAAPFLIRPSRHPSEDCDADLVSSSGQLGEFQVRADVHLSTLPTARPVKQLLRLVECFESALFVFSVQGPRQAHQLNVEP